MSKMCPKCNLCMTCGDNRPDHECGLGIYPDCDRYHRCPSKFLRQVDEVIEKDKPFLQKLGKSARESEAEDSERDME